MRLTDLSGYFQELYRLMALAFQLMAFLLTGIEQKCYPFAYQLYLRLL